MGVGAGNSLVEFCDEGRGHEAICESSLARARIRQRRVVNEMRFGGRGVGLSHRTANRSTLTPCTSPYSARKCKIVQQTARLDAIQPIHYGFARACAAASGHRRPTVNLPRPDNHSGTAMVSDYFVWTDSA
jgi:hypothetical protein